MPPGSRRPAPAGGGGRKATAPPDSESPAGPSSSRPVRQRRLPAGLQDSHVESPSVTKTKKGGGRAGQKAGASADKQEGGDDTDNNEETDDKKSQAEDDVEGDQVKSSFLNPVLWIRIQIGSVFRTFVDPYSEYGSGSTQVNLG